MITLSLIVPALAALVIAGLSVLFMVRYAPHWLPLDRPNSRSMHHAPIPRSGGLGILLGASLGWSIAGVWQPAWIVPALGLAVVSWIDDQRGLSALVRFASHFLAAAVFLLLNPIAITGLAWIVAILSVVWVTNLFNFMDGSDGLAGGMALIGFGAYAMAAGMAGNHQLSTVCWCLVGGNVAFLIFNFPPARIFMGDVGSVSLGFLAATIGLLGWSEAIWPIWFPFLVFSYFIIDATVTLLRRVIRRERVWHAHREHAYQRLIRSGWSHRRLALISWGVMFLTGITALLLLGEPIAVVTAGLCGWTIVYASLLIAVEVRWRRSSVARGNLSV